MDDDSQDELDDSEICDLLSRRLKPRPPWWNRRTRLERILCSVAIVAAVMCVALALALAVVGLHLKKTTGGNRPQVLVPGAEKFISSDKSNCRSIGCQSRGCVKSAYEVIQNLDESVRPCHDFYHFACGGWIKKRVIPEDKPGLSVFSEISEDLMTKLNVLIEEEDSELYKVNVFKKVRNMYLSCMQDDSIDKEGSSPLFRVLKECGGYPVLNETWSETEFDWLNTLIKMREMGYDQDILTDLSIVTDARNSSVHIIDLDQTDLGMPDRAYYMKGLNDSSVKSYYRLMVETAVLLGANRKVAEIDMKDALIFEMTLANMSLPKEERRNITKLYNKMTVSELRKLAPDINWLKFFNKLIKSPINNEERVIVDVPHFIVGLNKLLKTVDKRILANYMMWRITLQSISNLDKRYSNLIQEYSTAMTGTKTQPPRWKQCMGKLGGCLNAAVSAIYVRQYFPESSKIAAVSLVNQVLESFKNILRKTEWMDEVTRQKALDKANNIASFIGFPEELLDNNKIDEFCSPLDINETNLFGNMRALYKSSVDYSFGKLRKRVDKNDWIKHSKSTVANAFYSALTNSISFPAGILQGLFFDENRPNYMNYGAIGFIIGHEITHGFDDVGRQFDKDGNNVNWWGDRTNKHFRDKADCIIRQYGNFSIPEIGQKVSGINTQGENIADNGGLKEAYQAYNSYVEKHGHESILPSLNYTRGQLFWISAAQIWCSKYRPEALKLKIISGVHSPNQFRVNGAFANQPHFADDFNCPLGSPMNPSEKCSVW